MIHCESASVGVFLSLRDCWAVFTLLNQTDMHSSRIPTILRKVPTDSRVTFFTNNYWNVVFMEFSW